MFSAHCPRLLSFSASIALACTSCVRWQPAAVTAGASLPRFVQVTTRDSLRLVLENAAVVPGDTLVGQSADGEGVRVVRLAAAAIAHMEVRLPSGIGSIGVAAGVLGGLGAAFYVMGHTAPSR